MANQSISWPVCTCGHIAQDHNKDCGKVKSHDKYGCDKCNCTDYRFPDNYPQEYRDILEARRNKVFTGPVM